MKTQSVQILCAVLAPAAFGCIQVKTESEIKPIHITMDVNLKVDKELDKAFAEESKPQPTGDFKVVRDLLDRKVAGVDKQANLVARDGATENDRLSIVEENAKRAKRFEEVAKSAGVSVEAVRARRIQKMRENVPAGSGIWLQEEDGTWKQK